MTIIALVLELHISSAACHCFAVWAVGLDLELPTNVSCEDGAKPVPNASVLKLSQISEAVDSAQRWASMSSS